MLIDLSAKEMDLRNHGIGHIRNIQDLTKNERTIFSIEGIGIPVYRCLHALF